RTLTSWPILRLIDLMVRSGATTHWLRAALPTSSLPSSDSPTNEGRIGSPSSAKTCGCPSRMRATSLLVVPRSMPMMDSMAESWFKLRGDAHQSAAEAASSPEIAAAHFFPPLVRRPVRACSDRDRLHQLRVERLADAGDRFQITLLQSAFQTLQAHCIS